VILALAAAFYFTSHTPQQHPLLGPTLYFKGKVPQEIVYGDRTKKNIILTFDGGEGNQSAEQILATLNKNGIKGTFFLTGKFVLRNQDLVKRIHAEGHEIFNHTFDHPHLTELSDTSIASELEDMDRILVGLIGSSTRPYFRPPYGDRDERVILAAAQAGFRSVYWTTDALDWEESTGMTAAEVESRILGGLHPGTIVLLHLGDTITGKILDRLISEIRERGYTLTSLTQGI
jgi:peptidoglycan/xylan/chitin deacetylase (PgdA/CDA1 family)